MNNGNQISIEEIKKMYPDEWVLIGNPVSEANSVVIKAGIPIYHSKDKREVCYLGREKKRGYHLFTLFYTGEFAPINKIATIFSHSKI